MLDLHVDTLFQVYFHNKPLAKTQLGEAPPLEGALLSLFLPEGLRPTPLPPKEAQDEVITAVKALQQKLSIKTWLSFEGPPPSIEGLLTAGVVVIGLAHFWHSEYADAATDPRPGVGGLTLLGEEAVKKAYQAGALIDVSHLSEEAFFEVAALAASCQMPLIATHSGASGVYKHKRNLTDAQLRAIARSGGLIGVPVHVPFLQKESASSQDWARHVVHLIETVGPDFVALGSDLDGDIRSLTDVTDAASLSVLASALTKAGLSDDVIRKVMSENARALLSSLPRQKVVCR